MKRDELLRAVCKGLNAPTAEKEVSIAPPMIKAYQVGPEILSGGMDPLQKFVRVEDVVKYADRILAGFQADYRARIAKAIRLDLIAGLVEAAQNLEDALQGDSLGDVDGARDDLAAARAAFRAAGGEVGK